MHAESLRITVLQTKDTFGSTTRIGTHRAKEFLRFGGIGLDGTLTVEASQSLLPGTSLHDDTQIQ